MHELVCGKRIVADERHHTPVCLRDAPIRSRLVTPFGGVEMTGRQGQEIAGMDLGRARRAAAGHRRHPLQTPLHLAGVVAALAARPADPGP